MTTEEAMRWDLERGCESWPASLEDLECPPDELHGIGDPEVLAKKCISIIGARRATPYGLAVARMAGRVAAECGIVVVSGGAMGCDAAAARGALDAGGLTVVVAGTGADRVYPSTSADVFARAPTQGAVVSLEPWGQTARRFAFPKRNQVIAALSQSVVICEAGLRSGTFSTAMAANQLGRDLYAVPGGIFSPESMGANQLVAEGAYVIASEIDLEQRISLDYGILRMIREGTPAPEGRILSALIAQPIRPDDLARYLEANVLDVLKALADFEAHGMVTRLPDGRYSLTQEAYLARDRMMDRHGIEVERALGLDGPPGGRTRGRDW